MVVLDDESKVDKTVANIQALAGNGDIISASGIVGTPHAKAAIPKAIEGRLPLVGIRSGAGELRDGNQFVFHLRASFEEEISKVMQTAAVFGKLGILYSDDDFGRGALAQAEKVAHAKGVTIAAKLSVERNGGNVNAQAAALANLAAQTGGLGAILLCLIQKPALAATKELRTTHRLILPIFGMSFIATASLASSKDPAYDGMSLVSPFLLARVAVTEMAHEFRTQMIAANTPDLIVSPTAFEGFFYGRVLRDAIERGGPTRKQVQAYLLQQREIQVQQIPIKFDDLRVGYRHLELIHKAGTLLRA